MTRRLNENEEKKDQKSGIITQDSIYLLYQSIKKVLSIITVIRDSIIHVNWKNCTNAIFGPIPKLKINNFMIYLDKIKAVSFSFFQTCHLINNFKKRIN